MEPESGDGALSPTSKRSSNKSRRKSTLHNRKLASLGSQSTCEAISANITLSAPSEKMKILANGIGKSSYESLCKPLSVCIPRLSETIIQKALHKTSTKPLKRRKKPAWKHGKTSHFKKRRQRVKLLHKISQKHTEGELCKHSNVGGNQQNIASTAPKEKTSIKHTPTISNSVKKKQESQPTTVTPTKQKQQGQSTIPKNKKIEWPHNTISNSTPSKQTRLTQFMVPCIKNIQDNSTVSNVPPTKQTAFVQSNIQKGPRKNHSSGKKIEKGHGSVLHVTPKQTKQTALVQSTSPISKRSRKEEGSVKKIEKDCDIVTSVTPIKQTKQTAVGQSTSSIIKMSRREHSASKSVKKVDSTVKNDTFRKEVSIIGPVSKIVKQEYNVIVNVTPIKQIPSIQPPTNDLMCAAEEEIIDVETIPTEDLFTIGSPEATCNDENNEKTMVTSINKPLSTPQTQTPMVKIPICNLDLSWSEIKDSSTDVEEAQPITTHTSSEDLGNCSGAMLQDTERSRSKNLSDDSTGWKFRRKRNISVIDNIDRQKRIKKGVRRVMWADEEAAKDVVRAERTSTKNDLTRRSNELVETQDLIKGNEGLITKKKLQIPLLKLEDMLEHPLVKKWHLQNTKHSSEIEQSDGVGTQSQQHTKLIIKKSGTSTYTSHIVPNDESSNFDQQDETSGQCVNIPLGFSIHNIPTHIKCVPMTTPTSATVPAVAITETPDYKCQEEQNKQHIDSTEHVQLTEITEHAEHIDHSELSENPLNSRTEKISTVSEEMSRFNDAIVEKYNLIKEPRVLLWRLEDLGVPFIRNSPISAVEVERLTEEYTSSLTKNKSPLNSLTDRLLVDDNTYAYDDSSSTSESSESDSSTPNDDNTTIWSNEAKAYLSSIFKRKGLMGRHKAKRIIKVVTRLPKSLRTTKKDAIGKAMIYETLKDTLVNTATSKQSKLPTIISSEILRGSDIVSTDTTRVETLKASSPAKESKISTEAPNTSTDKSVHEQKEMLNVWKTAFLSVDDKKMASGFDTGAESRVWKHHTISSPSSSEADRSPSMGSNSTKQSTSAQRSVTSTPVKRKICETQSSVSKDKSPDVKSSPVKKHSSTFNRTGVYTCTECNQWYIDYEKLKKHFIVCERLKSKQLSAAQQRAGPRFTKLSSECTNDQSIDVKSVEHINDTMINTENEANLETEISGPADNHDKLGSAPDIATEMSSESILESTVDESTCNEESILASDTNAESTTRSSPRGKRAKKPVKQPKKRRLRQYLDNLTCNVCQWTADSKSELFDHVYTHTEHELQAVYNRSMRTSQGADQSQSNEKPTCELDKSATMSREETSSEKSCDSDKQPSAPADKSKSKLSKEQTSNISHSTTLEKGLDATPTKASISEKAMAKITDIPEDKLKLVSKTSPTISLSKLIVICECHKNEGLSVNHVSNTDALQIEINLFCRICRVLFRRIECFETHYRKPNNSLCNQDRLFGRAPRLFCNSCRVVLSSVIEMRRHLEMHFRRNRNGTVSFVCNLCKVIFIGIGEYFYSHWTSHSKNPMYIATAFSFRKSSLVPQEQFIGTLLNDDKVKEKYLLVAEYVCRDCKAVFELQTELIAHEPDCRRQALMLAANKTASNTTIRNESQVKPSTSKEALVSPRKMISQPRKLRLTCGLCNMNFLEDDAFQKHEEEHRQALSKPQYYRIPTKTKDAFLCKTCVNIYDDISTLEKHWVTHSKICKDFVCVLCDKRFKSKALFEEHSTDKTCNVQSADTEEYRSCRVDYFDSTFICKDCDECFIDERGLIEHVTTSHKDAPLGVSDTEQANKCVTRKSLPTLSPTRKLPTVRKSLDIQMPSADITETLPANTKSSFVSSHPRPIADSASSSHSASTSTENVSKDIQSASKKNIDSEHTPLLPKSSSQSTPKSAECAEKHDDDDDESDSEGKLVIELPDTDDENDNTVKTVEQKTNKVSSPRTAKESPEKNKCKTNTKGGDSDSGPELIILDDAELPNSNTQPRVKVKESPGKNVCNSAQVNGGQVESTSATGSASSNNDSKDTETAPPKKGFIRVKTLAELGQRVKQYACSSCTCSFNTHVELITHQWEVHSLDAIDELLRDLTEEPREPIENIIQLPNTNTNGSTSAGTNVSLVKPCYVRQRAQPAQETSGQGEQSQNSQIATRPLPYTATYQPHQQQSQQKQRLQRQQQPQHQSQQAIARPIGGRRLSSQSERNLQRQQQQQPQQQQSVVVQDIAMMQPQVPQRPHVRVHSAVDFYKVPQKYTSTPLQHFVTYVQPMQGVNTPPSSNLPVPNTRSIVTTAPTNTTQTNKPMLQSNINPQSNLTQLQASVNPTQTNTGQAQINKFVLQSNINPAQSNLIQVQSSIQPTQASINPTQSAITQLQTSMNRLQSNVTQLQSNNTVQMQPNVIAVQSVVPPTVYTQQHSQQGQYFFTTRRGEPQMQQPENTVVSTHYSTQAGPALYWSPIVPNYNSSTYVNSGICDVSGQQLESKQKVEFVTQNNAQASGYQVSISGTGAGNVAGTERSNQTAMAQPITFDQLTIRQQYPLLGTGGTTIHVNNLSSDPVKCITIQPTIQPQQQQQQQQQQQHQQSQ